MKILIFLHNWIGAWLDVLCGVVSVITFTWYRPIWTFNWTCWISKKMLKRRIENYNNNGE
jgi:hypothetical protein